MEAQYQLKSRQKNKKYRRWLIALSSLILVLIILRITGLIGSSSAIEVQAEKVERRTIVESISGAGKLHPEKELSISADVSGEIIAINIREGDPVKKGQLLVRIKPDEYQSQVEDAEAAYYSTRAEYENIKAQLLQYEALFNKNQAMYERYQTLKKKEAISISEFEAAESEYISSRAQLESAKQRLKATGFSVKSAEARLKQAKEYLNKTHIYAPMDGTVTLLNNEVGERVVGTVQMAGTVIMKIADLKQMEVNVDVNENDIIRIKRGDTALIEVDAYPNEKFYGIATELANSSTEEISISEQVTTFRVKISILRKSYEHLIDSIKHRETPFRPGMSAMVEIRTEVKKDVLSVPVLAVSTRPVKDIRSVLGDSVYNQYKRLDDDLEVVFVIENNTAKIKPVKTGIQDDYYIHITEGLEPDEMVVSGPYSTVSRILKNGLSIKKQDEK
jgi:HlyD family secretion protein